MTQSHTIVIRGDRALFARPDCADPMSYPAPPPSAVRGIVEKVYWHPGIYIDTLEIALLNPIQWDREGIVEIRGSKRQEDGPGVTIPRVHRDGSVQAPIALKRVTTCTVLRNPAWRVRVRLCLKPWGPHHVTLREANEILSRRLEQGQLFSAPYLGVARYSATIEAATGDEVPISTTRNLGIMLHDMDYRERPPMQRVYEAKMVRGVIRVPSFFDTVLSRRKAA